MDQAAPRVEAPVATESGEGLPPLTPTQEQFLEGLDIDRRQRFDALPAARRRAMLEPLALVCDPIVMREHVRALSPPAPPPPPPPAATAELWARLPDAPPDWIQAAAEALVNDLGPERERRYRPAHLDLAGEVWRGKIPAEIVLDAYRQGMNPKSKVPGKVFAHALKAAGVRWEGSRP